MTRFIHAADIHLGNQQYGLAEREDDFYRAFLCVVDHACREHVDFVLISGDLLHKASQTDARALLQATIALKRLRGARIPVIAIEGNHELQQKVDTVSFPQYLNSVDLIHLLDIESDRFGGKTFRPWDAESRAGGYFDLGQVRIFGMRYMGAQTGRVVEELAGGVDRGDAEFVIMMMHAGVEGEIPHMHGGLTMAQMAPLRGSVDYVALGHVHKKLEREGWIYNPGSTEVCSMDEIGPAWPHGFFDVDIQNGRAIIAHHITSSRPFVRLKLSVDGAESPEEALALVESGLGSAGLADGAVVEITITGITPFNRHDMPEQRIRAAVQMRCSPLMVRFRYSVSDVSVALDRSRHASRQDLERAVMEQIVRGTPAYARRAADWTRITLEVKEMIREGQAGAAIADRVRAGRDELDGSTSSMDAEPPLTPQRIEPAPERGLDVGDQLSLPL